MRLRYRSQAHGARGGHNCLDPFHGNGRIFCDPVKYYYALIDTLETAFQQVPGSVAPDRLTSFGVVYPGQCIDKRGYKQAPQTGGQEEHLQPPSQKFEWRQQITNMGYSRAIQPVQKFNTVVIEKLWITDQHDVADMASLDPL